MPLTSGAAVKVVQAYVATTIKTIVMITVMAAENNFLNI